MTKDEKLADTVWYYINEYTKCVRRCDSGEVAAQSVSFEAVRLDRAIRRAIRSAREK